MIQVPKNLGYELSYKSNNGYIPLRPTTTKDQVIGSDRFSQSYGPYQLTLSASSWVNKQQTVNLNGVLPTDILNCIKILTGTETEMKLQDENYGLLDTYTGINSLTNEVQFTCTDEVPTIDLTVQVNWVR